MTKNTLTTIRLKPDVVDTLRKLKKERGMTYNEIIRELLSLSKEYDRIEKRQAEIENNIKNIKEESHKIEKELVNKVIQEFEKREKERLHSSNNDKK